MYLEVRLQCKCGGDAYKEFYHANTEEELESWCSDASFCPASTPYQIHNYACSSCGRNNSIIFDIHGYKLSNKKLNVKRFNPIPITLTPYTSDELCQGHSWDITNEDLLAQIVAKVLMGKQLHVEKILKGITGSSVNFRNHAINDAINKLTLDDPKYPFHRDGLIFQIFSWITAHAVKGSNSILRAPHLVEAQKGFDGLQINIDGGEVKAVVIFEDKATENPRNVIRNNVWPEFIEFNNGQRESELQQEITTMLGVRPDLVNDIEEAIETIFWDQAKKFRVAITASNAHMSEQGRARLFKGYDEVIPGRTVDFRNAEYVYIPNLRDWMQSFSEQAIAHLNTYRGNNNV